MSQYSNRNSANRNSTILKVRTSEIQPGDILVGPPPADLPADLRLVRLPRGREEARDLPLIPYSRPQNLRRASSVDRDDFPDPYRDRGARPRQPMRRRDQSGVRDPYDSDGSVPPRSRRSKSARHVQRRRRSNPQDRYDSEGSVPPRSRRAKSANRGQKQRQSKRNGNDSSSASSSDLGCTDDDEKLKKKAKWKKWGAIGLAGVATIHAVHGGYETYEKTQTRRKELAEGEISLGEAKKKRNRGRWRTAADVGIAAVWIKSAYDEINEYRETKHEYAELIEKNEERHKKRIERAREIQGGKYKGQHALDNVEHYLADSE